MFLSVFLPSCLLVLICMVGLWLVSLALKNSSIVDIFWGMGFVLIAWLVFFLTPDGYLSRKLLIALLVSIWGLRLTIHILMRNWGKGEDFRYQKWRSESPKSWWLISLFRVFLLQGILMILISSPIIAAEISNRSPLGFFDYLGVVVWGIGFFFETVGDSQLAKFRSNPANKGKILDSGVWHFTRHPNYFGDSTQWWGFYLLALSAGGWWTIFSPILMTLFLIKVSGVALLEKTLKETKPGYKEYMERTNAFIPWFPRSGK
jgi:steroid 5-alpha reductase family enzyme